jgi:hypothetical protein
MSKLNREVLDLEMSDKLAKKMTLTYPAYLDWMHSNQLENHSFEDTKEFLAYLGLCLFEMWQENIPGLTLDDLAAFVFSGDKDAILSASEQ